MDSGEAALWGALIGAGSSLVVSIAAPLVSATIGERLRSERRRREQIRKAFPLLVSAIMSSSSADLLVQIARFQVLLKPKEWPIGEIPLRVAALTPQSRPMSKAASAMNECVTAWIRDEISPAQARTYFVNMTKMPVDRPDFTATEPTPITVPKSDG